jgi:beta-phosphoglucomutase-like phosphatase (HAD superfamily)
MSSRIIESVCEMMSWTSSVSVLASTHETKKSKPDPSVYLLAVERLAVPPERCVAFENEFMGFRSAVDAGITCQAIPDTSERRQEFRHRRIPFFFSLQDAMKAFA